MEIDNFFRVTFFPGTHSFFGQNDQNSEKITKSQNLVRYFFGRNWSWMFQNVFQTENLKINFPRVKVFPRTLSCFCQNSQNSGKMTKSKNFGRKFHLVKIDSECFKSYFNPKIWMSKIFTAKEKCLVCCP